MIIYETVNKLNNKRYIGKDSNDNPEYLGSGKLLNRAIEKYGRENFTKTILERCKDDEELSEREIHWIKITNAVKSKMYYNISSGGKGGDCIRGLSPAKFKQWQQKQSIAKSGENNPMYGKTHTKENKKKMSHPGPANGMHGKSHSPETILRQKEKAIGRYSAEWFIQRHGMESGLKLYKARNKQLSDRPMTGKDNPMYVHVDKDELTNIIIHTNTNLKQLCDYFKIGSTGMYGKFKLYYNCKNLVEVRSLLKPI